MIIRFNHTNVTFQMINDIVVIFSQNSANLVFVKSSQNEDYISYLGLMFYGDLKDKFNLNTDSFRVSVDESNSVLKILLAQEFKNMFIVNFIFDSSAKLVNGEVVDRTTIGYYDYMNLSTKKYMLYNEIKNGKKFFRYTYSDKPLEVIG